MRTHEQFLGELEESGEAVRRVAAWHLAHGLPVILRPMLKAPTYDERGDYADGGDLDVLYRIEVKHRLDITFTGRGDYPYPTAIIDACQNFDKKHPPPAAYYLLNTPMDVALTANVSQTRAYWTRENLPSQNGIVQPFYLCPVHLLGEIRL